jgi:hypothetical protein
MTALELLTPTVGWSQGSDTLQQVEQRLADKRAAAEAHRKQMENIKDPEQLTTAMRQHFQMTEEILALMLERRKLQQAQAATSSAPVGQGGGMPGGGMPGRGMMEHGRGMMQKEMGGMHGGGMQGGGMMETEMGGMQGSGMQGGGAQGSGTQGGSLPANPSAHSGMSGMSSSGTQSQSASAAPGGDMAQMMQRIVEHSAYMETLQDKAALAQEMLRHQKMLDQMLQLMQ